MFTDLLIMRHAKSSHDDPGCDDYDRPLTERGVNDALRASASLLADDILPDYIMCSPAVRTRHTAVVLCEALTIPGETIIYEQALYHCDLSGLLGIIGSIPDHANRPLIIGHNPTLESLLIYLCANELPRTETGKLLTTANIAHIRFPHSRHALGQSSAKLVSLIRPQECSMT